MVRCPVCHSIQFAFVVTPRRTTCPYCQASWSQDDSGQTAVDRPKARAVPRAPSRGVTVP